MMSLSAHRKATAQPPGKADRNLYDKKEFNTMSIYPVLANRRLE